MTKRPDPLAWTVGLPPEAVPHPSEVPPLRPGKLATVEQRLRMLTIARLYGRCGWTHARIGEHFGFGLERARQLVRAAGYWGGRGQMASLDPEQWNATRGF